MPRRPEVNWGGLAFMGAGAAQISFWICAVLVIVILSRRLVTFFNWILPVWRSAQILNVLAAGLGLLGWIGFYKFIRKVQPARGLASLIFVFAGTALSLVQRIILLLVARSPFVLGENQSAFFSIPFTLTVTAILISGYILLGVTIWSSGELSLASAMLLLNGAILEKVFINPQLKIMEAIMSDIKNLNYLIFAVAALGGLIWGAGSAWLGYSLWRTA